jgi:aspartokinase-like uncharacterized kinase
MWVVKLGGSLFTSIHLRNWLTVLTEAESVIVVPGGGAFADQVRVAQQQFQFDDSTAHAMALLAMEQFGRMLCGLQPGLVPASDPSQMREILAQGETAVWMPTAMAMADPQINHSWDVTSDSLAVWLSGQLGADQLLLVKSLSLDSEKVSLDELTVREVVDNQFGNYLKLSGIQAMVMPDSDHARFNQVYHGNIALATRILVGSMD